MSRKATSGETWSSSLEADHAALARFVESGSTPGSRARARSDRKPAQVVRSWLTVRTTFPVFCPVSTYLFASTTSSNG